MREVAVVAADAQLQRAIPQHEHNATWRFQVESRQVRAERIRHILSNPASVTLDIFNREMWATV